MRTLVLVAAVGATLLAHASSALAILAPELPRGCGLGQPLAAEQGTLARLVATLQRAKSISVRYALAADATPLKHVNLILLKPGYLKLTTDDGTVIADGQFIEELDGSGTVKSKKPETFAELRGVLLDPSLRIWLPFFDPNTFDGTKSDELPNQLLGGILCYSVACSWQEEPAGGFDALIDSQTDLPAHFTVHSRGSSTAFKAISLHVDLDTKITPDEFATKEGASSPVATIDGPHTLSLKSLQARKPALVLPAGRNFVLQGDPSEIWTDLGAEKPVGELTLFLDGARHSEQALDWETKSWKLDLAASRLTEGAHHISLVVAYLDRDYHNATKEIAATDVLLASVLPITVGSLTEAPDGTYRLHIKELPPVEGTLKLVVGGRSANPVPVKADNTIVFDGLAPGPRTCVGQVLSSDGFEFALAPQQVNVGSDIVGKITVGQPVPVTPSNVSDTLVVEVSGLGPDASPSVSILNNMVPVGKAQWSHGRVLIRKAQLFDGANEIECCLTLNSGRLLYLRPFELTASVDPAVRRDGVVAELVEAIVAPVRTAVGAFCLAAGAEDAGADVTEAFQGAKPIPTANQWARARDWVADTTSLNQPKLEVTGDASFDAGAASALKAGLATLGPLSEACDEMRLGLGRDGIIRRSKPSTLAASLGSMVSSIKTADEAAAAARATLRTLRDFLVKHSKSEGQMVARAFDEFGRRSALWEEYVYQIGYLRTVAAIVQAFPDTDSLRNISASLPAGVTTTWHSRVRQAIDELVKAIEDYRTDRDPTLLIARQKEAWETIRKQGAALSLEMDGLYEAAPKLP